MPLVMADLTRHVLQGRMPGKRKAASCTDMYMHLAGPQGCRLLNAILTCLLMAIVMLQTQTSGAAQAVACTVQIVGTQSGTLAALPACL